jgi:uncharacterized protein YigA (DUF484 family)
VSLREYRMQRRRRRIAEEYEDIEALEAACV